MHTVCDLSCVRRWPSKQAELWAYGFARTVEGMADVLAFVAVGSATRDTDASADVDFLIVHQGEPIPTNAPIEVDLRQYDANRVDRLIQEGNDYLIWAVKLGRVVMQRDDYWLRLQERWEGKLPWPSPKVAEERGRRARSVYQQLLKVGDEDAADEQLVTMLTHVARARLLSAGVFPASRPELPSQLRSIGRHSLSRRLKLALSRRTFAGSRDSSISA